MQHKICVVVHAGAGYHAKSKELLYNNLCSSACSVASCILLGGGSAVDASSAAVAHLEDSYLTNAGFGSNLTLNGFVECDAGIMCGRELCFAGVGAVANIRNPIFIAKLLLQEQINPRGYQLGRVAPNLLVGAGAVSWAASRSASIVKPFELISEKARSEWQLYRGWLENHTEINSSADCLISKRNQSVATGQLGTVGAVCLDKSGNVAASVSSGGVALKQEGRLGQACVFGAGCWAEQRSSAKVAVATSGTGEQLILTQFAQRTSERLLHPQFPTIPEALEASIDHDFLNSRFLNRELYKYAGLVGLSQSADSTAVEVFFGHTTRSMSIGYFVESSMRSPKSVVSRKFSERPHRITAFSHRV